MDLRKTILAEHSRKQTEKIINWVGSDPKRFDALFACYMSNEQPLAQRASWAMSYIVIAHPALILKHFGKLVKRLRQPSIHDALKRNGVRLMAAVEIPPKYHGDVMTLCFDLITDPMEKPAIKAFSLSVLAQLSRHYPEIKNELQIVIDAQWDQESPAFRSRARKITDRR